MYIFLTCIVALFCVLSSYNYKQVTWNVHFTSFGLFTTWASMEDSKVLRLFITIFLVTVPVQCSYYCYYYYNSYYSSRRQYCYYYYDYYYNDSSQSSYSSSAGVIAGAVIGGIVGFVIICAVVSWVCIRICQSHNRGQVLVYPQQPAVYTTSNTQQRYPRTLVRASSP